MGSLPDDAASVAGLVKQYYGEVLSTSADLATNACCTSESIPSYAKPLLSKVHDEVITQFYGCGSPLPEAISGQTVLDLGCGTGRDVYVCSALVGPSGRVIGVDMTEAQLEVARRHQAYHAEAFGHERSNVSFRTGYIEDLRAVDLADASVDVVISNCVINLSPDKARVFAEIFRVLKPAGELHFSDVFCDRRIPAELASDPVLLGECLGGALYVEDFRRLMRGHGCLDHRVMTSRRLTIESAEIAERLAPMTFTSMTIRAFKLPLEDRCEDYGQVATYLGTIPHHPRLFALDDHHVLERGRPMRVCGNTADMLSATRFGPHFDVRGDKSVHFGLFPCGPDGGAGAPSDVSPEGGGACC